MLISDLLHSAFHAVSINKSRSLLTMLGIIIGVGSVTLMTGIGKSMEGVILGQISILGPESMVIFAGSGPESGGPAARSGFDSITDTDVEQLHTLKTIKSIAPVVLITGMASHGREEAEPQILGTNPDYFNNLNINIGRGRLLDWSDEKAARFIAVLGPDTAEDLFYNEDPIGKKVKISGRSFTVVGITDPVGTAFFSNLDERIYVPLVTAQQVTQQKYYNLVSFLRTTSPDLAVADVESLLRSLHKIENPDDDDFIVRSSAQAQDIFGTVSIGLTSFITSLAAISLIVGGIGIMNIMLVAVSERTREIGLRKALGATRRDVLRQFLVEAIVLTLIGGLIGIFFGIFFAFLLSLIINSFLSDYVFAVSISAIVLSVSMAAFTGLVFGLYPARKAAELSPMEALRYE